MPRPPPVPADECVTNAFDANDEISSPSKFNVGSLDLSARGDVDRFMVHIANGLENLQRQQNRAWQQQVHQTQLLQQLQGCPQQEEPAPASAVLSSVPIVQSTQKPQAVVPESPPEGRNPAKEAKLDQKAIQDSSVGSIGDLSTSASLPPVCSNSAEFQVHPFHASVLKRKVNPKEINPSAHQVNHVLAKLDASKDPNNHGHQHWCRHFVPSVRGSHWELTFGFVIVLNTMVMSVEMQVIGLQQGHKQGYPFSMYIPPESKEIFAGINDLFLAIFVIEILIKWVVLRCSFWHVSWDVIDFCVVLIGVTVRFLGDKVVDLGIDPVLLRLFRLIRLLRFLKLFKLSGNMHSMNLILKSVMATRGTLLWSMILLFMVQWIAGMFLGQMVQSFLTDDDVDRDAHWAVYRYYGTFTKTQFTMFEITHVNYSMAARVLVDNISEWWCWFFVGYRCLVAFAFLQVIRAVFIQMTLKVADRDKDLVIHNKRAALRELHQKLGDIFNLLEVDGDGAMSMVEFVQQLEKDSTKIWMSALDIDVSDPDGLFELLDLKGNGEVSLQEFTFGAAQLRGAASGRDLFHLQTYVERLEAKLDTLLPSQFRGKVFPTPRDEFVRPTTPASESC